MSGKGRYASPEGSKIWEYWAAFVCKTNLLIYCWLQIIQFLTLKLTVIIAAIIIAII